MSLIRKDSAYIEPSYIDFFAQLLGNGSIILLRYRLFPGFPAVLPSQVETTFTYLIEHTAITLNQRIFASINPSSGHLVYLTELEKVVNAAGRLESLTPRYILLDNEQKWVYLPPYNPRGAPIGEEIRVTMDFSLDEVGKKELEDIVKEAHMTLKPFSWLTSPTPGEFENIQLPYHRLFLFLDAKMKQNSEKSPTTIGSVRLPIPCLALLFPLSEGWQVQVEELTKWQFSSWRKCIADGNCYYRSVGVAYLEGIMRIGRVDVLEVLLVRIEQQQGYYICEGLEDHHYYFHRRLKPFLEEFRGNRDIVREFQPILEDVAFDLAMIGVLKNLAAYWVHTNLGIEAVLPYSMGKEPSQVTDSILAMDKFAENLAFIAMPAVLQATINHFWANENAEQVRVQTYVPVAGEPLLEVNVLLQSGHYDLVYKEGEDQQDHYDVFARSFI